MLPDPPKSSETRAIMLLISRDSERPTFQRTGLVKRLRTSTHYSSWQKLCNVCCMEIWNYDRKTGVLLGPGTANPNPVEPGRWLIPAYATTIRPPHVPEGCVAIFNGGLSAVGEWRIELCKAELYGVVAKELAAVSGLINTYIEDREDREGARSDVMRVAEAVIDRDAAGDKSLRDEAKILVRNLIYGKSVS
jgi:hypothetical protein